MKIAAALETARLLTARLALNAWQRMTPLDSHVPDLDEAYGAYRLRTLRAADEVSLQRLAETAMDPESVRQTLRIGRLYPRLCYGAFRDGELECFACYRLGWLWYGRSVRCNPFLYWIVTLPQRMGSGLGGHLLGRTLALLEPAYAGPCELLVACDTPPVRLYTRLGFTTVCELVGRPGVCLMRMSRRGAAC
jgi:GNAT superfamily N-acetyltransferase